MKGLALSLLFHTLLFASFMNFKSESIGFKNNKSTSSISVNIYRKRTTAKKVAAAKKESKAVPTADLSGVKEKVILTNMTPPTYPEESRLYGEEGIVTVDLEVNGDGQVTNLQLSKSSGYERLDLAVITQMKSSQFQDYKGEKLELSFKFELAN